MQNRTFRADNKFAFNCPIFHSEVELAGCFELREQVARGHKPPERRGCQAAMCDSKCPVIPLIARVVRGTIDEVYSAEPKVGSLPGEILTMIAPVQMQDRTMDRLGVVGDERAMLLASNTVVHADGSKSAKREKKSVEIKRSPVKRPEPKAGEEAPMIITDMSVVVNQAMAELETAPPVEPPKPEPKPAPRLKPAAPAPAATPTTKPRSLLDIARAAQGNAA